jgi:hypothetical protein
MGLVREVNNVYALVYNTTEKGHGATRIVIYMETYEVSCEEGYEPSYCTKLAILGEWRRVLMMHGTVVV